MQSIIMYYYNTTNYENPHLETKIWCIWYQYHMLNYQLCLRSIYVLSAKRRFQKNANILLQVRHCTHRPQKGVQFGFLASHVGFLKSNEMKNVINNTLGVEHPSLIYLIPLNFRATLIFAH